MKALIHHLKWKQIVISNIANPTMALSLCIPRGKFEVEKVHVGIAVGGHVYDMVPTMPLLIELRVMLNLSADIEPFMLASLVSRHKHTLVA